MIRENKKFKWLKSQKLRIFYSGNNIEGKLEGPKKLISPEFFGAYYSSTILEPNIVHHGLYVLEKSINMTNFIYSSLEM